MPADLATAVSFAPWFASDTSLSWCKAVPELIEFYNHDKNSAVNLPFILLPQDFEALHSINELYTVDRKLVESFLQCSTLSRDMFLALSDLSKIAAVDRTLASSLVDELTQDDIEIISSLADIYSSDSTMGKFASEHFYKNKVALRYLQKMMKIGDIEPELLTRTALFVSENPEFICKDRIEPYRYHLLTEILSEIPEDTAHEYKTLLSVICSVYGNRFYLWQNAAYNTRNGWAYDEQLDDVEKDAVIDLIIFFVEKNQQNAFIVDLREESYEYLYGVVDIPFTHVVNSDGTLLEAVHKESGTGYVCATIANIAALKERCDAVRTLQFTSYEYAYSNPLVDLILKEGGKRDVMFVYFCAKNWECGPCMNQTLQTRMDCIVTGISTTTMHWNAHESAHIYPAYIPTDSIYLQYLYCTL
jgi:hypothetical protein